MLRTTRALSIVAIAAAAAAGAACSSSGTTQPTVVVGVPTPSSPAADSQIGFGSQPITLTVTNTTITGASATVTYTFEVATDSAFANKVQTKDVPQGTSGQTSVTLDTLTPGKDYYWHARAQSGATVGSFSNAQKFTLVSLTAPAQVNPQAGVTYTAWPLLTVVNVQRAPGSGAIVYKFDVATDNGFTAIIDSQTVPEGVGQTSIVSKIGLSSAIPVFWRATAIDQSNNSSSTSDVQSFTIALDTAGRIAAQEGIALWPGRQPPGNAGQARLGNSWNVQNTISFGGVLHVTPTIDELRVFDVLDRGLDPQSAINWINSNGYSTNAAWYSGPQVIGFSFEYMALISGRWDLVFKME